MVLSISIINRGYWQWLYIINHSESLYQSISIIFKKYFLSILSMFYLHFSRYLTSFIRLLMPVVFFNYFNSVFISCKLWLKPFRLVDVVELLEKWLPLSEKWWTVPIDLHDPAPMSDRDWVCYAYSFSSFSVWSLSINFSLVMKILFYLKYFPT